MIRVIEPGLNTTVQDLGRNGYYHLGVPPSGAADRYSFMIGNILVGNPKDYASLEMTLLGATLEFHKKTVISLTGAPANATSNGKKIPMWEAVLVEKGDILEIPAAKDGVKIYLSVSGGIIVPEVLGCKSTYLMSGFGGFKGRTLQFGDELVIGEPLPGVFHRVGKRIPEKYLPLFSMEVDVRVVMGVSSYCLSDEGVKAFLDSQWQVQLESNNVAYRFRGASIPFDDFSPPFGAGSHQTNVVDIAYPIGAIMVTNSEELIMLLHNGTTGGGFITIGTTINADIDVVAQARPFTKTRFIATTVEQAIEARIEKKKRIVEIEQFL